MQLNDPCWSVCWAHLYPEVNSAWIETSEILRGLNSAFSSSSGYQGSSTDLRGVSAKGSNPSPPPGGREWPPLSAGCAPAPERRTLCHSCCSHSLPTRAPCSARGRAHLAGGAEPAQGARVSGQTPRGNLRAAGGCWWHLLCGDCPSGAVLVTPPALTVPVDHAVPRKGSKAGPGRRRLLPGSCGSPRERQQRFVRFHAVITTLGTGKDHPSCAPFAEFSGLPLAKQM